MPLSVTNAVSQPIPHLDGKYGQDVSEVTGCFKFQPEPNSCYPNCIRNVLKALSITHHFHQIAFTEKQVNKLCGYKMDFGPDMGIVFANVNRALKPFGYGAYTRRPMTYDALVGVVKDTESSYPLIEVSHKYLEDRCGVQEEVPNPPDHMIVILSCDPNETIIYDPYDVHNMATLTRPDRIGRGLYLLSTGEALDY